MKKCDVVIPVYKAPEWVVLCLYALFNNTNLKILNKVYLVDDCNDELTDNCLQNLQIKYGSRVVILKNKKNLGFIGSTNRGLKKSTADYVLLLNTDCILSKNAIEKMINNISADPSIGLVCPISSNAANLSLEMFEGFNYSDINNLLESKFSGILFDACTIVGNCLLITRECINKIGYLDEAYGLGYGEETDYQFKAMKAGFKAKVSIDTYVFHKSEASFGISDEKQKRLQKNRELFFSRWGDEYKKLLEYYNAHDPINYILKNLSEEDKIPKIDNAIYLNGIVQNAGGVHVTVDMVNYLAINGISANIIYDVYGDYKEIMLFNPIASNKLEKVNIKNVVATIWSSVFSARKIAVEKNAKLLYFVQGYECLFENGGVYGIVETSMKLIDSVFTISRYLQKQIAENYYLKSTIIGNGINHDLIYKSNNKKKIESVTFVLRNSVMKGDWISIDLIRKIDNKFKGLDINVIYMNEYIEFPQLNNNKLNKYLGPLKRSEVIEILQKSDCYIDCSLNEGFGLTPLEAMAAGNVVIVSNSFGINDYLKNGFNGFVVKSVNNPKEYIKILDKLINEEESYINIKNNLKESTNKFDYQNVIKKYIGFFANPTLITNKKTFTERDRIIIQQMCKEYNTASKKRKLYYVAKLIPRSVKRKMKKVISFLYNNYSH